MGSFAFTCGISQLPIHCGDDVRFLLVTENPFKEHVCYPTGVWFPRTWPIRAKYNDYGTIEEYKEGPFTQNWLDLFKRDLVERGWGNNSCHDNATMKDWTFADMLDALRENRILVEREGWRNNFPKSRFDAPPQDWEKHLETGIPTIRRISAIIEQAGFTVFDGGHSPRALMIDDDEGFGYIRVRVGDYGSTRATLKEAEKAIKTAGYGCLMTPGTGHYADSTELLVRPKPGTKGWSGNRDKDRPETLKVREVMIREDVWQSLLTIKNKSKYEWSRLDINEYYEGAEKAWERCQFVKTMNLDAELKEMMAESSVERTSVGFTKNEVISTVALGDHFKVMAEKGLSDSDKAEFLKTAAEFLYISRVISQVRHTWRPSYSSGPQCGEWDLHAKVNKMYAKIALDVKKANQ